MKKNILLLVVCCLVSCVSAQRFDIKFNLDGHLRECIIVKPPTAPPKGGYPVVFMLHGTSGDGKKFFDISGWKELGIKENFITVFPTSLSWCFVDEGREKNLTRWVNGNVTGNPCSGPPQKYVDDIKFLKKLVTLLSDTVSVNSAQIFACGFSNGSAMIHKMAMDAGDVFAAVAGSSGPLTVQDSIIPPVNRIPIWFMVGSMDTVFLRQSFKELPYGRDSIITYLGPMLNRALACQGLKQTFVFSETSTSHIYTFNETLTGGISKSPYVFSLNKGQSHEFPNGINDTLVAAEVIWDFFKQSTASTSKIHNQHLEVLSIYPNPCGSYINVKTDDELFFNVFDSNGKLIRSGKLDNKKLSMEDLSLGVYYVKLYNDRKLVCKKIIKTNNF